MELYNDDCLKKMPLLKDKSIDMILCDLPYGATANKWDNIIDFNELWKNYERIIKDNGAIVLFSQQPFTSKLVMSNYKLFRYEWVMIKNKVTGFLNVKKMPFKAHENICVFYKKLPTYNPQMIQGKPYKGVGHSTDSKNYNNIKSTYIVNETGMRHPKDVIFAKYKSNTNNHKNLFHPTQKPIEVCEYLIKTYTNKNDLVLDNCMGGGTTGIACKKLGRDFIGIEMDKNYYEIAKQRIDNTQEETNVFNYLNQESPLHHFM